MPVDHKTVTGPEVPKPSILATMADPPAQATTTSEEQKHTKGQRWINLIWELTQATIAITIVQAALVLTYKVITAALAPDATEQVSGFGNTAFTLLSSLVSLVIGFYFGRTNHQRIGGVQIGR